MAFTTLLVITFPIALLTACSLESGNITSFPPVNEPSIEASETLIATTETVWAVSPDLRKIAYRSEGGSRFVVNGTEGKKYDSVVNVVFSPDSKHFAYIAWDDALKQALIVIDEVEKYSNVPEYRDYPNYPKILIFSPNSKRLAYVAKEGAKEFMFLDGVRGKQYEYIGLGLVFSPNSRRVAYSASEGNRWFVVVNGVEGKGYTSVGEPVFSPDSNHLAYSASTGDKSFVVMDSVEGKQYDSVRLLTYSPDSEHLAYVATSGDKWFVVVDGVEGRQYDYTGSFNIPSAPVFSPDSKHLAYLVTATPYPPGTTQVNNKSFVVLDGVEGKQYDLTYYFPIFSPDSQRLAYAATEGGKWFMVVDSAEGKQYASLQPVGKASSPVEHFEFVTFSQDSRHFAYIARGDRGSFVVVDGVEQTQKQSDYSAVFSPTFSPDSKHLAYGLYTAKGELYSVVIDGVEGNQYKSLTGERFIFDSGNRLHYLGRKGKDVYLVEAVVR